MFDLEKAIASWRRSFRYRRVFFEEDLEELERHVRDHVAGQVEQGWTAKEAFGEAVRGVGDYGAVEAEYQKVFWAKLKHRRGLLRELVWEATMLTNYFKIALRNLKKHKGYALINVSGLAVGLACCLLIMFYVQDELSYDRHFPEAERIYRVTLQETSEGRSTHRAVTPPALAPTLMREFAEVHQAVRFGKFTSPTLRIGEHTFYDVPYSTADDGFFEIFRLPFVWGDPATALDAPNSIVLTRTAAKTYFGDANPLGQRIIGPDRFAHPEMVVTGVIEDIPSSTHFSFDVLLNREAYVARDSRAGDEQWWRYGDFTYVLLSDAPEVHAADLEAKLVLLPEKYMAERPGIAFSFHLQPVTRIHLYSHLDSEFQPNSHVATVYTFSGVALLILLIACINFMNLATARATQRAREVGVRKVVGAHRSQLVRQFLGESVLLASVATGLALVLTWAALPLFIQLSGKELALSQASLAWLWLGVPGMAVGVGLLAGSYPALFLSAFRPALVLKGSTHSGSSWAVRVRRGLVITQFVISIILLVSMAVIYNQWTYMQQADLGFDKEHVVVLPYRSMVASFTPETIKQELLRHPGIRRVSMSRFVPTKDIVVNGSPMPEGTNYEVPVYWHVIDVDYIDTFGLDLIEGRSFSNLLASDTVGTHGVFVINETAVKRFGWAEPLDKALLNPLSGEEMGRVIGVVRDFHMTSLHEEIQPLVYWVGSGRSYRRLIVRLNPGQIAEAMDFLEQQWARFAPGRPFDYFFLDEHYDTLYRSEQRLSRLIGVFALLAIGVACLGLFGLAAFTAEQRTKEIGIRKVLGASVGSILVLLSTEYVRLVLWAVVLASPLAYFATHRWLEEFAYRIEISWPIFLIAGLTALGIALLTVSYQSIRAALADPVESLRYE